MPRLFVACMLSPENQAAIHAAVTALATDAPVRPVPINTAHLTMTFIGSVEDADELTAARAVETLAETEHAHAFTLGSPQILLAHRDPRLVHLPVSVGQREIDALARRVHRALSDALPRLHIELPKSPHVTVARFRKSARPSDAERVRHLLTKSAFSSARFGDRAAAIQLLRSSLSPAGPTYVTVTRAEFRTDAPPS